MQIGNGDRYAERYTFSFCCYNFKLLYLAEFFAGFFKKSCYFVDLLYNKHIFVINKKSAKKYTFSMRKIR